MKSRLRTDELPKMADRGQIGGILDGPQTLDHGISKDVGTARLIIGGSTVEVAYRRGDYVSLH
jgi:hypothetical protein